MNEESYEWARNRVQRLRGFYVHLSVYVVVNVGLIILNLLTSTDTIWFYYPALGWGVGLLAHGLSIARFGFFGKDWENRKIKKLMEREAASNPDPLKEPV